MERRQADGTGRGGERRSEAKRGARIYSAKSKPQRDRSHQVTNYFEFPSIKSKVACRPNEHESARLIEHRTYLELSRSAAICGSDHGGESSRTLFVGFRGGGEDMKWKGMRKRRERGGGTRKREREREQC